MKNNIALLIFLVVIGGSCKNSEPAPVEIFSIVIDPAYTLQKDNWVMIHDANGTILDAQQTNKAGTYIFKSANKISNNRIGVTIFAYDSALDLDATVQAYRFRTFLQIPTGQQWNLKHPPVSSPQNGGVALIGSCHLTVANSPPPIVQVFSSNIREFGDRDGTGGYTNYVPGRTPDFLLTIAGNDDIRYQFFTDVKVGDELTADFTTMKIYDHIVDVPVPNGATGYAQIFSIDHPTDARPSSYYLYLGPVATVSDLKLGYLDQLKSYYTNLSIVFPSFSYRYQKVGSMPDDIAVVDQPTYTVSDESFLTFAFSGDKPFAYRTSSFVGTSGAFTWDVSGPSGTDKVGEFPADFARKYPDLNQTHLKHVQTSFSILPSTTWAGFIDNQWISVTDPYTDSEEAWIYVH